MADLIEGGEAEEGGGEEEGGVLEDEEADVEASA